MAAVCDTRETDRPFEPAPRGGQTPFHRIELLNRPAADARCDGAPSLIAAHKRVSRIITGPFI